jgi:hypothetical protein
MPTQFNIQEETLPKLDEFRAMFTDYYELMLEQAIAVKFPEEADMKMSELYKGLGPNGKALANIVISEWLQSEDNGRQFAARSLTRKFHLDHAAQKDSN